MGKKVVVVISDDYNGAELSEADALDVTLAISVDGKTEAWGLVLSATSLDAWRKANVKFISKAETSTDTRIVTGSEETPRRSKHGNPENKIIREWWANLTTVQRRELGNLPEAPENGRGRVPIKILDAYEKDTAETPPDTPPEQ